MMVFPFERSGDLMTITARVWGPQGYRELVLVIDTGAAATSIEPAVLEGLGYSSRDAIMRTRWEGASTSPSTTQRSSALNCCAVKSLRSGPTRAP
jgi:hypothetical protein